MIAATLPGGKAIKLGKLNRSLEGTKEGRTWETAEKLIPLRLYRLFNQDKLNRIDAGTSEILKNIIVSSSLKLPRER